MRSHSFCLNPFILKHARHQDVELYHSYFQEFLDHTATDGRTDDGQRPQKLFGAWQTGPVFLL